MRRGRRPLSGFQRLSLLKMTMVVMAACAIAGAVVWGTLPLVKAAPGATDKVRLTAVENVFTYGEQPQLRLSFTPSQKRRLFSPDNADAASDPRIVVDYSGHLIAIPTQIQPDGSGFTITLEPRTQLEPGSYKVTASGETPDGQNFDESDTFAWGVLAINTTKSIYLPGEIATIQMGVLSSTGHTLCAAPLELSITDPNGGVQHPIYETSSSCQGDSFNGAPDYTASYKTAGLGRYRMKLGIAGTAYFVTDSFEVRASVPFDITRTTATRIYPTHPYSVDIQVAANQDFTGTATETISNPQFRILQSPGATVRTLGNQVILSWPVSWRQGGQYDLIYEYLAPPVSPAFYTLGPLKLTNKNGAEVFSEARAWQLAADAAITFENQWETDVTTAPTGPPYNHTTTGISTTAGDTLILLVATSATGISTGLSSIADSAGNTWTFSSTAPNQNPPANYATSTSSDVEIGYVVNASAITSITVGVGTSTVYSFDLLEFRNIDSTNPVDQSASNDNETASFSHTTPSVPVTTCNSPTTNELMRGGDYFCTSPNELIVGIVNAGHQAAGYTLNTVGFTATTAMTPQAASDEAAGAYEITPTSDATDSINWTSNSLSKKDGTGIMVFQQNGNTSGGDRQPFFWEP